MAADVELRDLFCTSCKMMVQARVATTIKGQVPDEVVQQAIDPENSLRSIAEFQVAFCGRCHGPFLLERTFYEVPGEFATLSNERVLYPQGKTASITDLPPSVHRTHDSAAASFERGLYEPCLIMCRKCLEAVCREFGTTKGNLKEQLDALRAAGNIDDRLRDWAHQLRLIGNDAAHDLDLVPNRDDAKDALEFTEAILLYAFSLRRRFEKFKARRQKNAVVPPEAR